MTTTRYRRSKQLDEFRGRYEGWIGYFCCGLAVVRKNKKWFHIKHDGTPAYEQRYDWVGRFVKGHAQALIGKRWLTINTKGVVVK